MESIKQHKGKQQVDRAVVVVAPGKHFPFLSTADQKKAYDATAVEFRCSCAFLHIKAP